MDILTFPLGTAQANCYFLIKDKRCLIIDPADEGSFILEQISRRGLKLIGMLATHGHFDHVMAAGEIQLSFNVPLYIHPKDNFLVKRINKTAEYFLGFNPKAVQTENIKPLKASSKMRLGHFEFRVIHTPGHTPGGCSIYFDDEGIVFTGDTLFKGSIGRYDFSYCSYEGLKNSLLKLFRLPGSTIVYPGHGEDTTIEEEKEKKCLSNKLLISKIH